MVDDPMQKAREFFDNLNAEAEAVWTAARKNNPTLTDDELIPIVREMYVRQHAPALFRVGVNFSAEQKEQVRSAMERGHKAEAQRLILDGLANEFDK